MTSAELLVDAEQHLELELRSAECASSSRIAKRLEHEPLVVGRDADERAAREHLAEAVHVVPVDDVGLPPRDRARLDVDPLAEPEVRADGQQRVDVARRAPQVGLQHDADVVVVAAERLVDVDGAIGVRRVLHVDAHEVAERLRVLDHEARVAGREVRRQVEAERRQLDRHVRVELLDLDRVEDRRVGRGVLGRRLLVASTFSPRRSTVARHPADVELADHADGVRELLAGDVAIRDPSERSASEGTGPSRRSAGRRRSSLSAAAAHATQCPSASRNRSASIAAMQPEPAAVTACR